MDPLVFPAFIVIHGSAAVVRHEDLGNTAEALVHVDMCGNPRLLLFIHECLYIRVLAVGHHSYENVSIQNFAGIWICDMCRISSLVYLDLFRRLTVDMHSSTALLLILLDVIAELGVHKRLISGETTFLKALCPKEFFVYSVTEKFFAGMLIFRPPL